MNFARGLLPLPALDPAQMLGDLPDSFNFTDNYKPEVDAIELSLADVDTWIAVQSALTITDLFSDIDSLSSDLDGMINDFTSYDYSSDANALAGQTATTDSNLSQGYQAIGAVAASASALAISIPPIGGVNITPPAAASSTPTLPPVVGQYLPQPAGGVNAVVLTGTHSSANANYFYAGTSFKVVVTGPKNVPVYAISALDGKNRGQALMGVLNAQGKLTITGTFSVADLGDWAENWYVGNVYWGSLNFLVIGGQVD